MAIPEKVRIGPITYTVSEVHNLCDEDGTGKMELLYGNIDYGLSTIAIGEQLSGDIKLVALFHEVVHGILHQAGIFEHPESLVKALSFGLVGLLRDNSELLTAIRDIGGV